MRECLGGLEYRNGRKGYSGGCRGCGTQRRDASPSQGRKREGGGVPGQLSPVNP